VQNDWGEEWHRSFEKVTEIMSSEPILKLADLSQKFYVQSDATDIGIAAVLMQKEVRINHTVMYAIRKLLPMVRKNVCR